MTSDGTDQAFERAHAKISNARSEGAARTELARESMAGRLAGLEDVQANSAADEELARMEQKLGLGAKPSVVPTTTANATSAAPANASDIDRQLQELEARVGGNNGATPS